MLPGKVKWKPRVTMKEIEALKAVVKKSGGKPTPCQVDLMRYPQWLHVNDQRSDTRLKNYPYRNSPVESPAEGNKP